MLQMIHWFTKNTQYESPDTMALLDAILVSVALAVIHLDAMIIGHNYGYLHKLPGYMQKLT